MPAEPRNACRPIIRAQSTALMETEVGALCVRMKHLAGTDKRCGDGHRIRRHYCKAHESAGALIGAPLRADSEASIGGSPGGRGSAQKRCQPLVKCDGNCSEMPVKTW
jgi:hypothetical protein